MYYFYSYMYGEGRGNASDQNHEMSEIALLQWVSSDIHTFTLSGLYNTCTTLKTFNFEAHRKATKFEAKCASKLNVFSVVQVL